MQRVAFHITGLVQGVLFRKFAKEAASALGVTGFVENVPDGSVRGEVQGNQTDVAAFLEKMKTGPARARVDVLEQKELSVKDGEQGFQITTVRLV